MIGPLLLAACGGDLLPGEAVLGEEVPAVVLSGEAGSRYGAALAVGRRASGERAIGIAAPDAGRVEVRGDDGALLWQAEGGWGLGVGLAWLDGAPVGLSPGEGIVRFDPEGPVLLRAVPAARDLAVCPDGSLLVVTRADEAVACGPDGRTLELRCADDGACEVRLDGAVVGPALPGGDVGFDGEVACWGVLDLDDEAGPGEVRCEDGRAVAGIAGEHLGVALGQGWAAGTFTKWEVPARGRAVPLGGLTPDGQQAWIVDRAAEATALAVEAGEGLVLVGVPGYLGRSAGEGRVYVVDAEALTAGAP